MTKEPTTLSLSLSLSLPSASGQDIIIQARMNQWAHLRNQSHIETPKASFITAQGNALGSWSQKPSGALKARLILIRNEAGRWPATEKRAMNPGRCPTVVELRQKGSVARPSGEERDWSLDISGSASVMQVSVLTIDTKARPAEFVERLGETQWAACSSWGILIRTLRKCQ